MPTPLSLVVLLSGSGRTLQNLLHCIDAGNLPARVECVVSSRREVLGVEIARRAGIETHVVRPRDYPAIELFSQAVFEICRSRPAALVVMAGYLQRVLVPPDYVNRVVNIHPSLLPAFGGQGFYGRHVHEAALAYGVKVSGCTVHFVDNQYDHGPIVLQQAVPVLDGDDAEALAARVFAAECQALPAALTAIAEDRVTVAGRAVHVAGRPAGY